MTKLAHLSVTNNNALIALKSWLNAFFNLIKFAAGDDKKIDQTLMKDVTTGPFFKDVTMDFLSMFECETYQIKRNQPGQNYNATN